jgi:hypothetical protein
VPESLSTWQEAARRLSEELHLNVAPIATTFATTEAAPFAVAADSMPEPTLDRRTRPVPGWGPTK